MIDPTLDLIMNLEVFTFIGLLIWLYFKSFDHGAESDREEDKAAAEGQGGRRKRDRQEPG